MSSISYSEKQGIRLTHLPKSDSRVGAVSLFVIILDRLNDFGVTFGEILERHDATTGLYQVNDSWWR